RQIFVWRGRERIVPVNRLEEFAGKRGCVRAVVGRDLLRRIEAGREGIGGLHLGSYGVLIVVLRAIENIDGNGFDGLGAAVERRRKEGEALRIRRATEEG